MNLFSDFLSKYPPFGELRKPSDEILEMFRGTLPEELLDFWQEYGFGNYGGGLLKVVNPFDYMDSLYTWLGGVNPTRLPILITAFGNIFYYRKLSETDDDVCLLDIHYRKISNCTLGFQEFFEDFIIEDTIAERLLDQKLFKQAVEKKGALEENEIFFFVPAIILGGSEYVDFIEIGNGAIQQQLLFQMGTEECGDSEEEEAWLDAYEASPEVFQMEDDSLVGSLTLTENIDTILPVSPESMYGVEGKTIDKWVISFFSLTKSNVLDRLEYKAALQRLEPYAVETRESFVMIRGLNLEEMIAILSAN